MDGNIQVFDLAAPWLPESCSPLLLARKRAWSHRQGAQQEMGIRN